MTTAADIIRAELVRTGRTSVTIRQVLEMALRLKKAREAAPCSKY